MNYNEEMMEREKKKCASCITVTLTIFKSTDSSSESEFTINAQLCWSTCSTHKHTQCTILGIQTHKHKLYIELGMLQIDTLRYIAQPALCWQNTAPMQVTKFLHYNYLLNFGGMCKLCNITIGVDFVSQSYAQLKWSIPFWNVFCSIKKSNCQVPLSKTHLSPSSPLPPPPQVGSCGHKLKSHLVRTQSWKFSL